MLRAMNRQQPVGIVVPTEGEFAPYRALLSAMRRVDRGPWEVYEARAADRRVALIISDCGPANAAAATERLIAEYAPAAILHGGSAGAHNPDLLPGDLVIGTRSVIHTTRTDRAARAARGLSAKMIRFRRDGERVHLAAVESDPRLCRLAESLARREVDLIGRWTGAGWPSDTQPRQPRVVTGVIASADAWTADEAELQALRDDFGAECEDMESAYVAQICALHAVPFLAVRAISNNDAVCALAPSEVMPAIAEAGASAARVLGMVAGQL